MRLALAEAEAAAAHDDVPIGAVILGPDGEVLARAGNERELHGDPTAHAEVVAIRCAAEAVGQGAWRAAPWSSRSSPARCAPGPSSARGWLASCSARSTTRPGPCASLWDVVRDPRLNHRPEVVTGVLADECAAPLERFFAARRT